MTDGGRRVLQALADGASTPQAIAKAAGMCGRKTRAALTGCLVAGLCAHDAQAGTFAITDEGIAALAHHS